jgi:ATP-binding cassette subfamily B protein
MDAEAEREIFAELRRTRDTRITIVVSHRAWTLRETTVRWRSVGRTRS